MQKNITFVMDENLIQRARKKSEKENTSLNALVKNWIQHYVHSESIETKYSKLMKKLDHVKAGRHFTRAELNER